jgi:hypothetical protein
MPSLGAERFRRKTAFSEPGRGARLSSAASLRFVPPSSAISCNQLDGILSVDWRFSVQSTSESHTAQAAHAPHGLHGDPLGALLSRLRPDPSRQGPPPPAADRTPPPDRRGAPRSRGARLRVVVPAPGVDHPRDRLRALWSKLRALLLPPRPRRRPGDRLALHKLPQAGPRHGRAGDAELGLARRARRGPEGRAGRAARTAATARPAELFFSPRARAGPNAAGDFSCRAGGGPGGCRGRRRRALSRPGRRLRRNRRAQRSHRWGPRRPLPRPWRQEAIASWTQRTLCLPTDPYASAGIELAHVGLNGGHGRNGYNGLCGTILWTRMQKRGPLCS